MIKGRIFEAKNLNSEIIECEVIMAYHALQNDTDYVFYTDNNYDDEGNLNLYASRYLGEDNGNILLEEIEDENEWDFLDKVLDQTKEVFCENGR